MIIFLAVGENIPAAKASNPLSMAMQATGAKVEEWSISSWVRLPTTELDDNQLEELVKQTMNEIGIYSSGYEVQYKETKHHKAVEAVGTSYDLRVVVTAQIIFGDNRVGRKEGFLVINVEGKEAANQSMEKIQEKINRIIKKTGSTPQINTCLIGWLDGKLKDREWCDILRNAFMTIDAQVVDKLEAGHFASYTGFSPRIIDSIQVGGKKINLNVAIRYSQYDNRTYITIGSPIITREY